MSEHDAARSVRSVAGRLRDQLLRVPGLHATVLALRGYITHQSANQAGSVAFSAVLAMFPLLLLVSSAAAFFGRPGDAAVLADRVVAYAPPLVRESLEPVVDQVLRQRSQALLAIGFFATLWTASSGMQAIRTALNRAYGVQEMMPFWKARIKVTLFTVIVGVGTIVAFSSVVIMPHVWILLESSIDEADQPPWLNDSVRYAVAWLVLVPMYALLYGWLPDIRQRARTVLPGALFGATLWVGAAALLSYTLRGAGKLLLVYGGFAGMVATLVFLYISAATLIFGAELNGVMRNGVHEQDGGG